MSHVVIGTCPHCLRALKAKEHAPRLRMHITCHCGWRGNVDVDEVLVAHANELRKRGAGHRQRKCRPSQWERFTRPLVIWWQHVMLHRIR